MAGEEWPEFSIPSVDTPPAPVETPAGDASADQSAQAGSPAPTGGTPATPVPAADQENIPKYRYDKLNADLEASNRTVRQLQTLLQSIADLNKQPPAAVETDPRKAQILKDLLDAVPELKDALELAKQKDRLLGTLQAVDTDQANKGREWDFYAKTSLSKIHDALAPVYLGKGKIGKDLDNELKADLTARFVDWLGANEDRVVRYNTGDTSLRDEFVQAYLKRYVEPFRRSSAAEAVRGARSRENLPTAGGGQPPLGTPPPNVDNSDEDAVFRRAWAQTKQLLDT